MKNLKKNTTLFSKYLCLSTLVLLGSLLFIDASKAASIKHNDSKKLIKKDVDSFLKNLTLEQKIGQLFIFGFRGKTLTSRLKNTIRKYQPGSLILFGHNITSATQIAELNHNIQSYATKTIGIPLFLAVDQEGGHVTRIKTNPPLPSALSLGTTRNLKLAYDFGSHTGKLLGLLGFNMNLAPVLDLHDENKLDFIGTRSFGHDPMLVGRFANSFALGLQNQKIVPTGKHFPGHGGTTGDTHHQLLSKPNTMKQLQDKDFKPFKLYSKSLNKNSALMIGHISLPNVDPTNTPATYSKKLITDILRNQIGYNGIVMTDDLEMSGAKSTKDVASRCIKAINAGNDILMIAWSTIAQKLAYNGILSAVKKGKLTEKRIDESLRRILSTKANFLSFNAPLKNSVSKIQKTFNSPRYKDLTELVVKTNIKKSTNPSILEKINIKNKILIFSASRNFYVGFKKNLKNKQTSFIPLNGLTLSKFKKIISSNSTNQLIYYVSGNSSVKMLNQLTGNYRKNILVINTLSKSNIHFSSEYQGVIEAHSRHPKIGLIASEILFSPKNPINRIPSKTKE